MSFVGSDGTYDVGGDYSPDAGLCSEKCICNALDVGLTSITAALLEIDLTLQDRQDYNCEIVGRCRQEIIDLIDEHYRGHTKTCQECKNDLAAGLGGTVEYAVACAGACLDETKKAAQCDSLSQDGEACDTCSCKPCICTGLECVSVDESACESEAELFSGWCNPVTGSIVVRKTILGSPGPNFIEASQATTEAVAFAEAEQQCIRSHIIPPNIGTIEPVFARGPFCSVEDYISGKAIDTIVSSGVSLNMTEGSAEALKQILKFGFEGLNVETVTGVLYGAFRAGTGAPAFWADQFAPVVAAACGVPDPRWAECMHILTSIAVVGKFTGMDFEPYTDSIRYTANAVSRMQVLNPGQAMDAYLAHAITSNELDAHWAMGNICNESLNQAVKAAETKPSPGQLIAMRNRDIIDTNALHEGFRRLGYLDNAVVSKLDTLSEMIPEVNSVLMMAQKHVTDDGSAGHFQLDQGLPNLNAGKLHAWFKANAIKPETAKMLWRSHWNNPSVSDLFMFWHRLRADGNFGSESEQLHDIRETLNKLGVTPYWQKHYLATMLNPLPIRSISQAYVNGALPDKELKHVLQVTGADDTAVKILTAEYKITRRNHILSHIALRQWTEQIKNSVAITVELQTDGYDQATITQALLDKEWEFERSTWAESFVKGILSKQQLDTYLSNWGVSIAGSTAITTKLSFKITDHVAVRSYIAGTISRTTADQTMFSHGIPIETITKLLYDADQVIADTLALDCVRGIKHRYMTGEITNVEATNFLANRGLDANRITDYVSNFDCERSATGRQVAVEKLCHWLYIGAIGQPEFMDRLLRLGYSEENAALLLYDCVQSNTLRAIKEADKISRQLQSNIDKQARAKKQAEATVQRNAERLATARKKKAKLRADRDAQLLSASEKLYKNTPGTLSEAIQAVKDGIYTCDTRYGLGVDECLKIVILASEQLKGHSRDDFHPLVVQLAEAAVSDHLEPTDAEVGILPNSNGSTHPDV